MQAELALELRSQSATPSRRAENAAAGAGLSAVDSALSELRMEARRREARIASATAGAESAAAAAAARAEQLQAQRMEKARAIAIPARLASSNLCGTAAVRGCAALMLPPLTPGRR